MEQTDTLSLLPKLELEIELTDEQFWQLCQKNRDWRFERPTTGELIIMPPTGGITGERNSNINFQLQLWNRQYKLGKVFDSSTGFKLPNGADRSPDASWIAIECWNLLTPQQQEKFIPLCPDFVIELRSKSDSLTSLQLKMQEYINNGAKLGWLIDPQRKVVEIYRPNQMVAILESPETVSENEILPGFILDLSEIF